MAWFGSRKRRADALIEDQVAQAQSGPPESAEYLGVGLWNDNLYGLQVVRVFWDREPDSFYFDTGNGWTYGGFAGGYGRRELATLYLTGTLTLSRDRLFAFGGPSVALEAAVLTNRRGEQVLSDFEPEDGIEALLADPDFHADAP